MWPVSVTLASTSFRARAISPSSSRMYGFTNEEPESNIGRFWSSTIWIRKPSGVTSIRTWLRSSRRRGLRSIASSTSARTLRACASDIFCISSGSACRLTFALGCSTSPRLTCPVVRVRSSPPPLITLELSPDPEPPSIATCSGVLKWSAMPLRSPFVVDPSSHISRKNAIIAVTKSAYAIFQAPPW